VVVTGANDLSGVSLWGGNSGDYHTVDGFSSTVTGSRTLAFENFTGKFVFEESVGGFDTVTFTGNNKLDAFNTNKWFDDDVTNWTFADYGVAGTEDFVAASFDGGYLFDFDGDTLDVSGASSDFRLAFDNVKNFDTATVLAGDNRTFGLITDGEDKYYGFIS